MYKQREGFLPFQMITMSFDNAKSFFSIGNRMFRAFRVNMEYQNKIFMKMMQQNNTNMLNMMKFMTGMTNFSNSVMNIF
tara:strand:+ start:916 stop:1152 length:237 start_codon:yes stop_codon:yes gene_type:complete